MGELDCQKLPFPTVSKFNLQKPPASNEPVYMFQILSPRTPNVRSDAQIWNFLRFTTGKTFMSNFYLYLYFLLYISIFVADPCCLLILLRHIERPENVSSQKCHLSSGGKCAIWGGKCVIGEKICYWGGGLSLQKHNDTFLSLKFPICLPIVNSRRFL